VCLCVSGIARCFTYGGAVKRPLYDEGLQGLSLPHTRISKEEYMRAGRAAPTINHFYEKLFLLKDLMKTGAGRNRAAARHQLMLDFVEHFKNEVQGLE
jgi:uncharacterized protein